MKAQRVKNAVIVPTGAKGGFYPKQLPDPRARTATAGRPRARPATRSSSAALLSVTDNIVGDKVVHPETRGRPRRGRSLFRGRGRQGHGELFRHRQCDRRGSRFLARRRFRFQAARRATTTRRWASPRAARGFRSSGTSSNWAWMCRRTQSGWPAAATCRAMCSATACCCRRRSSWSRPSTTATSSSIRIPIQPPAGRSANACSSCRVRAGKITTRH